MSSLLRYAVIRVGDNLADDLTAAQVAAFVAGIGPTTTQEDLQRAFLSQVRRLLWGTDGGPHRWYEDFASAGVLSLAQVSATLAARVVGVPPVGAINGSNVTYTTPHKFVHQVGGDTIRVYFNGLRMYPGEDYTLSESGGVGTGYDTITLAYAPRNGDHLLVDYTRS